MGAAAARRALVAQLVLCARAGPAGAAAGDAREERQPYTLDVWSSSLHESTPSCGHPRPHAFGNPQSYEALAVFHTTPPLSSTSTSPLGSIPARIALCPLPHRRMTHGPTPLHPRPALYYKTHAPADIVEPFEQTNAENPYYKEQNKPMRSRGLTALHYASSMSSLK